MIATTETKNGIEHCKRSTPNSESSIRSKKHTLYKSTLLMISLTRHACFDSRVIGKETNQLCGNISRELRSCAWWIILYCCFAECQQERLELTKELRHVGLANTNFHSLSIQFADASLEQKCVQAVNRIISLVKEPRAPHANTPNQPTNKHIDIIRD